MFITGVCQSVHGAGGGSGYAWSQDPLFRNWRMFKEWVNCPWGGYVRLVGIVSGR